MRITEITVHASRTLPHPTEQYANFRPSVTLRADLIDGDDPTLCVKDLQRKAEMLVEEHALLLRSSLMACDVMQKEADEIQALDTTIHRQTQRLEELKERHDQRATPDWLVWGGAETPGDEPPQSQVE